ncbi:MAG TPA: hypothetical protein VFG08_02075 [Candidatus Polarisedimenticolia bacterium]|nr:hypothetical protein [Candidatus Polarisedimenticolia bacterium]
MRALRHVFVVLPVVLACLANAAAQSSAPPTDRDTRRLFQRFIEDAVVAPGGWVEGQFSYRNLPDDDDLYNLDALIAFHAGTNVEAGLRFGYVNLDAAPGPDGSGLSDVDLYGKYVFPGGRNRLALGGLLKLPTADEDEGLGTGKPDLEAFGAWRGNYEGVTVTANAGIRLNGNPDSQTQSSEDSALVGAGLILPVTPASSIVIEWSLETRRFEGDSNDSRLTPGFQKMFRGGTGGLRGAVAIPLSDAAPDYQVIFGVFFTY